MTTAALLSLMRSLAPETRQNRLLRCQDQALALVIHHLGATDQTFILQSLSPAMRQRLGLVLARLQRVRFNQTALNAALRHVADQISSDATAKGVGQWYRPTNRRP